MSTPTRAPDAQHTAGPWTVGHSNEVCGTQDGGESFSQWLNIKGPDGEVICELPGHSQFAQASTLRVEDANAVLIARAPQLHAENAALIAERDRLRAALDNLLKVKEVREAAANWATDELLAARESLSATPPAAPSEAKQVNGELRRALVEADYNFDLLAGYGLPEESPAVCYSCMKDIASDAKRKTSAALARAAQAKGGK